MQKNILFLTKYARSGASSRYRTFQYLPWFEKSGLSCDVSALFDNSYLAKRYSHGSGSKLDVLFAFVRRLGAILRAHRYDLVVIEYELFPYFPIFFEKVFSRMGLRYVVDYDDALFHQYDQHSNPLVRRVLGKKIATVMKYAEVVVVGNAYLAAYAHEAGAKRVEIIPTVIDMDRYPASLAEKRGGIFTIGWIGSPSTAKYLKDIAPVLSNVCRDGKAKLRLVGSGEVDIPGVDVEVIPWSEGNEVELMHSFDVGIMPLPDEPWARGKCGFKLIQYMACGLPVIASSVGVNSEIVEHGENGFLATNQADWRQALEILISHPELKGYMGQAGRKKVEHSYCLQLTSFQLRGVLTEVMDGV